MTGLKGAITFTYAPINFPEVTLSTIPKLVKGEKYMYRQ